MLSSTELIEGLSTSSKKPKLRHFPIVASIDAQDNYRWEHEVIEFVARMETREMHKEF
jgi:hypothetical protein